MKTYGQTLDTVQLEDFLAFFFTSSLAHEEATGERPTPVCIWGPHGLGKTASVMAFARERGWKVAYCAPAQFEEIGDLHGLPTRVDPSPEHHGDEYTAYLPPEWVPREEGPGILLLDDLNRADDRILRGLMQLLQNFEMFSWTLPNKWQIVCTANPEDSDYSVTPMDDAMLTRMLHVSLRFDVRAWAAWALRHGVDSRGVDFVLTYPELVSGQRTTPRSLVQVFTHLARIPDLKKDLARVSILARSGLDDATANAFLAFVNDDLDLRVSGEDILDAPDFAPVRARIEEAAKGRGKSVRLDRLSTICTRLLLVLAEPSRACPTEQNRKNVVAFLMMPQLPADLRFSVHREISAMPGERPKVLEDAELARLVLKALA